MNDTQVINFWFKEITPKQWWAKDIAFDQLIKEKFGVLHQQAAQGELFNWRETSTGSLAEIIILDQFSRNIYRDTPCAFASDPMALTLSQVAVTQKFDQQLTLIQKSFLYMPFMHSESKLIHQHAVKLYAQEGLNDSYDFELKHKVIIDQFGRYPYRNKVLGRISTAAEIKFLKEPNSSF